MIAICDEVFFKLRVYFDELVSRKKVLSDSSYRVDKHIGVVVEVLEVQSIFALEFCLDEYFIEFWWADIVFDSPHATIFVEFSLSNGGDLLLAGTTVVVSWSFGGDYL